MKEGTSVVPGGSVGGNGQWGKDWRSLRTGLKETGKAECFFSPSHGIAAELVLSREAGLATAGGRGVKPVEGRRNVGVSLSTSSYITKKKRRPTLELGKMAMRDGRKVVSQLGCSVLRGLLFPISSLCHTP